MRTLRLGTGAAALAFTGLAVLGTAGPGFAQQGPKEPGFNCPNPAGKYPPGQCKKKGVSQNSVRPGDTMSANSGSDEFNAGSGGEAGVESTYQRVGSFTADSSGNGAVTFTVPNLEPGRHDVVFRGSRNGEPHEVRVPFTVASGTAVQGVSQDRAQGQGQGAGSRNAPSSLPFTGSGDLIPLTAAGAGLVLVGAGVVVAARRRRTEGPAGLA